MLARMRRPLGETSEAASHRYGALLNELLAWARVQTTIPWQPERRRWPLWRARGRSPGRSGPGPGPVRGRSMQGCRNNLPNCPIPVLLNPWSRVYWGRGPGGMVVTDSDRISN